MFLHRQSSEEEVRRFISAQQDLAFSYAEVGATQGGPRAGNHRLTGYNIDRNRTKLGAGEETFRRAVSALRCWKQFDLGWVRVVPPNEPLEVGTTVAVQAKVFGLWSLNAARIVYVIDEEESESMRYGFAYGTLPDHVECGEERFTVEWRKQEDDSVWYYIYAFSRPRHPLVKLGFPITRMLQKRFARDSLAVMTSAISAGD